MATFTKFTQTGAVMENFNKIKTTKTNLKPLIDEGYRYFAIDDSEGGLNGAIMGKFKVFDDAMNFYNDTLYVIYTADRLVELYPDFFEIKEESVKELDLTQILKDCPKGTKLYSPIFGEVEFVEVENYRNYPITVQLRDGYGGSFTKDGKYCDSKGAECMLFPSRENRDWSKFQVEQPKPKFETFQRVLVRGHDVQKWKISLYSYYNKDSVIPHVCIEDCYNQCIPYEGNEALLGTTNEPNAKK